MNNFILSDWISTQQDRIETVLAQHLALESSPQQANQLSHAMRYATLGGGKRLRALLVYATGAAFDVPMAQLDHAASAVELIHAYSLVHDDMPAMDDDDLRRGKPTCHKAFDEATALLTGDALQTLAFSVLAEAPLSDTQRINMVSVLAQKSGAYGMAGGQAIDLASVGKQLTINDLETMHCLKTAALIQASITLGGICSPSIDSTLLDKLNQFALTIGLAFQIQDDVLDVISDTQTLGKAQGADLALNKPTYPALLGLEAAQQKAHDLIQQALDTLNAIPYDTTILSALAQFVINRKH